MKTALITGAGRGIGKATALKFLAEGWAVLGTTQSGSADYSDPNLKIFQLDLTSADSIATCVGAISANGVKVDALINNAGILEDEDETHVVTEKLRKTLEVNLIGTADFTERCLPLMAKGAHIVNISSQAGSISDMDDINDSHDPYHYPAYKISKAALNMFTRILAANLKHEGSDITVSSVHPGWVRTDMGGAEAPTSPEEAANDIYDLAVSRPPTGGFWFKGKAFPW